MKLNSFRELFLFLLSDIYTVENQFVADLPLFIKKAESGELKKALENHLNETKKQVVRLNKIFELLQEEPAHYGWARNVRNLFVDVEKFLADNPTSLLTDSTIIAIEQRIQHFEIATYGTLRAFAKIVNHEEIASILDEALQEEVKTDTILTKIIKGEIASNIGIEIMHKQQ